MEQKQKNYKVKKIGPYLLLKQIGSGSFSIVYKAKIENTYEKVAVKMISINKLSERVLLRVQQEIGILNKIKHQNIVRILDFKKSDNNWYLVFEYCQHGDLDNYIKKYFNGFLPEQIAQKIIQQLSSAFQILQQQNIVHRDLKLANILVGQDFVIKIADFGFAKCIEDHKLMTSLLGTPITMAPEILEGKQYNEKCDIWSLGVIIYQMVMGKPPFIPPPGQKINGLREMINKGLVIFDPQHPISNDLKDLIVQMLVKDPDKRISFPEFFKHKWVTNNFQQQNQDQGVDIALSLRIVKQEKKNSMVSSPSYKPTNQKYNQIQEQQLQQQQQQNSNNKNNVTEFNCEKIEQCNNQDNPNNNNTQVKNIPPFQQQQNVNHQLLPQVQQQQQIQQNLGFNISPNKVNIDINLNQNQIQNQNQKLGLESILMMNISFQLRKFLEKGVVGFVAGLNQLKRFFDCQEQMYKPCQFLSSILIAYRLHKFLTQKIILEHKGQQIVIKNYSYFTGLFLEKGEKDIKNFALLLKKKMLDFCKMAPKYSNLVFHSSGGRGDEEQDKSNSNQMLNNNNNYYCFNLKPAEYSDNQVNINYQFQINGKENGELQVQNQDIIIQPPYTNNANNTITGQTTSNKNDNINNNNKNNNDQQQNQMQYQQSLYSQNQQQSDCTNFNESSYSHSQMSEIHLLEDNYSVEYLLMKGILELASTIEKTIQIVEERENHYQNLLACTTIYEKSTLPDNILNVDIFSKKVPELEISAIFENFSKKGLLQNLQEQFLRNNKFFEEFRRNDDYFVVTISQCTEQESENLKIFNEFFKSVLGWVQQLTQIKQNN